MVRPRVGMSKFKEVLRLYLKERASQRQVAKAAGVGKTYVQRVVNRAQKCGLSWADVESTDDSTLEGILFCKEPTELRPGPKQLPDWAVVHEELKRKGTSLKLLWIEYFEDNPGALKYSRYCDYYRAWKKNHRFVMRQEHKAGEKVFVDFAGLTIPYLNLETGEVKEAQIFVAVMGASSYTFSCAVADQTIPNWISCHVKMFDYFGGVPKVVVPDNLRSAVSKACRYEPEENPTYRDLAWHYDIVVLPARPYKPRDKAKVEVGVQVVERWILAVLRKQTFTSISEINRYISELLKPLNEKIMRHVGKSRTELFNSLDKPELRALPQTPFEIVVRKKVKPNIDYHIDVERHYYSVPYKFVGHDCEARYTSKTVEVFHKDQRIAVHLRSNTINKSTTLPEHMPSSHRAHAEWTPSRIVSWGKQTGPSVAACFEQILASKKHPELGFRSCLGILRLGKDYSNTRLEAACKRALTYGAVSYHSIRSILSKNLDSISVEQSAPQSNLNHENIRGSKYYH